MIAEIGVAMEFGASSEVCENMPCNPTFSEAVKGQYYLDGGAIHLINFHNISMKFLIFTNIFNYPFTYESDINLKIGDFVEYLLVNLKLQGL